MATKQASAKPVKKVAEVETPSNNQSVKLPLVRDTRNYAIYDFKDNGLVGAPVYVSKSKLPGELPTHITVTVDFQ